jgi:hypothetical protein
VRAGPSCSSDGTGYSWIVRCPTVTDMQDAVLVELARAVKLRVLVDGAPIWNLCSTRPGS